MIYYMTSYTIAKLLSPVGILLYLVLAWLSLQFGFGQEYITLVGLGLAGVVEILSLIVISLKLLGPDPERILKREKLSTIIIGTLYLQLAFVVGLVVFIKLSRNEGPGEVTQGLTIGLVAAVVSAILYFVFRRMSLQTRSATLSTAGHSFVMTLKLSLTLMITSFAMAKYPELWWIDNFGGLFLAIQLAKEGITLIRSSRRNDFNR